MKKSIISLLLILALCFGLCACGTKLNEEQMSLLCGTWYLRPYHETGDNPGYFEMKEDGTGSFNGQDAFTWKARPDRENPELLHISIKMENKDKYTLEFYTGDPNYAEAVLTKDKADYSTSYMKAGTQVQNTWFADLLTSWYAVEEDAPHQSVVVNADGTAKLGDKTYFWTNASDWEYNENSVHLNL